MDCRENAQAIVDLFNDFYKTDPEAASALFSIRVPCNDAVADHPDIVVAGNPGSWKVGVLGLLNGLFGEKNRIGMWANTNGSLASPGFLVTDVSVKKHAIEDSEVLGEFLDGNLRFYGGSGK